MTRPYRLRDTDDTPPQPCLEQVFGRFVHREFPVQIARVKAMKRKTVGEVVGAA